MATAGDNAGNGQSSEAGKILKTGWLTKQGKTKLSIVNLCITMYTSLLISSVIVSLLLYIQCSVDYSLGVGYV